MPFPNQIFAGAVGLGNILWDARPSQICQRRSYQAESGHIQCETPRGRHESSRKYWQEIPLFKNVDLLS